MTLKVLRPRQVFLLLGCRLNLRNLEGNVEQSERANKVHCACGAGTKALGDSLGGFMKIMRPEKV